MKKLLFILSSVLIFSACRPITDSDSSMQANQEKLMSKADRGIGMPSIKNFQERKLAKMIFELRDREDLVCYAYIVNHMTGKLVFLGKCIGYGLPYSIQYTNPEKRRGDWTESPNIPQADPNGLFMPDGMSATWLMMIDPNTNKPRPVYLEPEIIVSPFKLTE